MMFTHERNALAPPTLPTSREPPATFGNSSDAGELQNHMRRMCDQTDVDNVKSYNFFT